MSKALADINIWGLDEGLVAWLSSIFFRISRANTENIDDWSEMAQELYSDFEDPETLHMWWNGVDSRINYDYLVSQMEDFSLFGFKFFDISRKDNNYESDTDYIDQIVYLLERKMHISWIDPYCENCSHVEFE